MYNCQIDRGGQRLATTPLGKKMMGRSPALQWYRLKATSAGKSSTRSSSLLTWTRSPASPAKRLSSSPSPASQALSKSESPAETESALANLVKRHKPFRSTQPASIAKRLVASVLKKAVTAAASPPKTQRLCSYFVRNGSCKRAACPLVHDRSKVAVCRAWLAGTCRHQSGDSCRLAHDYAETRMPDCSFFLQGICAKRECPFRHVKLPENTPPCGFFARGYCPSGNR